MPRRHVLLVAAVAAFAAAITTATGASIVGSGASARADRAVQQREVALSVAAAHRGSAIASAARSSSSRRGPRGPRGLQGPIGPQGPPGAFSAANVVQVSGPSAALCQFGAGTCSVGASIATCPPGKVVIGGGWDGETNPPLGATVSYDRPVGSQSWDVVMVNDDNTSTASFHTVAICAG